MKKLIALIIVSLIFVSCSGYKIGSMGHPQIKRVSIGKIKNLSDEPRLALYMMEKLKEAIRQDGTYELVNHGHGRADAIIQGTLPSFTYQSRGSVQSGNNDKNYRSDIYRATVTFKYEVVTPKGLIIQTLTLKGSSDFSESISMEQERSDGLRRACYNLSTKVVTQLSEGW